MILKDLFQRLSHESKLSGSPRPCDIFDLICGTSTGGIIALMLGRLHMSVDEAIDAYIDFSSTVFGGGRATDPNTTLRSYGGGSRITSPTSIFRQPPKKKKATDRLIFDASKLEIWMKKIVSKRAGGSTSLADPHGCQTFVVAVRQAAGDAPPKLFRSYGAHGKSADNCEIWQAARATTAAFPFFDPATFGKPGVTYVDGELSGANNPSRLAIEEVESIFPSQKIGCLLSLGTGIPDSFSISNNKSGIADACEKILKSCEKVHDEAFKIFKTRLGEGYIRLSVDRGFGNLALREWRETDLAGKTDGYLASGEVEERVTKCMTKLKERAKVIIENKIT